MLANDPAFFEQLVLDVLFAMGYGANREELEHVGRSGDGGIDGAVSLDKLGLEKVYVQAKRYTDNSVGRPAIQQFIGALHLKQATKGVFFTSSSFTQQATSCAREVQDSIVLIDGPELTRLMIKYGVGVTHEVLKKPRVDGDYFADE